MRLTRICGPTVTTVSAVMALWREPEAAAQPKAAFTLNEGNPLNAADVRFLIDGAAVPDDAGGYQRIVPVFDGDDDDNRSVAARRSGIDAKAKGFAATYWQPDEKRPLGEKKA